MKRRPHSAGIHTPKDSARCNALTSALRCAEVNKLNKQIKSSERELESLRSERDSIINEIEGAQKFKSQRGKRARKLNKELVKIDESISKFEKVLDSVINRLEPTHPPTKRIERKISELNKKN